MSSLFRYIFKNLKDTYHKIMYAYHYTLFKDCLHKTLKQHYYQKVNYHKLILIQSENGHSD